MTNAHLFGGFTHPQRQLGHVCLRPRECVRAGDRGRYAAGSRRQDRCAPATERPEKNRGALLRWRCFRPVNSSTFPAAFRVAVGKGAALPMERQ